MWLTVLPNAALPSPNVQAYETIWLEFEQTPPETAPPQLVEASKIAGMLKFTGVGVIVNVRVGVGVIVGVLDGVAVGDGVGVGVLDAVGVRVLVAEGVLVGVGVQAAFSV